MVVNLAQSGSFRKEPPEKRKGTSRVGKGTSTRHPNGNNSGTRNAGERNGDVAHGSKGDINRMSADICSVPVWK
jgi:hypothetical protein